MTEFKGRIKSNNGNWKHSAQLEHKYDGRNCVRRSPHTCSNQGYNFLSKDLKLMNWFQRLECGYIETGVGLTTVTSLSLAF